MALEPRFRRVAALRRTFVDREGVLASFARELDNVGAGPRVVNLVGVGGIGKSRLLREIREHWCGDARTALLDLQVPAMRQQEDALAALRADLAQQGIDFDRFDIAYAVLWQRLHPHLRIGRKDLPFVQESEILAQIVDSVAGIPLVGTAVGLTRLVEQVATGRRRKQQIRADDTLRQLDELTTPELIDSITYLFAQDVREASADRPYIVLIDAYDALVPTPLRSGRAGTEDVWLRDLLPQLDRGLVVVASREPLGWEAYDPEWAEVIRVLQVGALPMSARREILTQYGIEGTDELETVAAASQGLPFYLQLAVDTPSSPGEPTRAGVVSTEEILQRFLHNVSPREIRALELLSVARMFDFDIFRAVAEAFSFSGDRMTWESLTAYSFIFPAMGDTVQLHQLMRISMRRRLSPAVAREIARLIAYIWQQRADAALDRDEPMVSQAAIAIQEAVYSRLQAGSIDGTEILAQADQVFALGGRQSLDGILTDLRNHLDDGHNVGGPGESESDLAVAASCLGAETAVLLGQGHRAVELAGLPPWPVSSVPGARLATAAANGHRIEGDTCVAQRIFRQVWEGHTGPARNPAGVWIADLDMCQGRFPEAVALAEEILASCAPDDYISRGDVQRLLHLTYRFSMDFDRSLAKLRFAQDLYEQADSAVGRANTLTNATELLSWTRPEAAITAGAQALAAQAELGAQHEIGKIHTAIALAQLRLGELEGSADSFDSAVQTLDRAGYRSGRARAELFRTGLHARTGNLEQAVESAAWAVAELVEAEVYPTLIIAAAQVLDRLGRPNAEVARAAARARSQIHPLDSLELLEDRLTHLVVALLGDVPT